MELTAYKHNLLVDEDNMYYYTYCMKIYCKKKIHYLINIHINNLSELENIRMIHNFKYKSLNINFELESLIYRDKGYDYEISAITPFIGLTKYRSRYHFMIKLCDNIDISSFENQLLINTMNNKKFFFAYCMVSNYVKYVVDYYIKISGNKYIKYVVNRTSINIINHKLAIKNMFKHLQNYII